MRTTQLSTTAAILANDIQKTCPSIAQACIYVLQLVLVQWSQTLLKRTMQEVRYTDLLTMLSSELEVNVYPQKLGHWCERLGISGRNGWYDSEDQQALMALGVAFTRHKYRGQRAIDYAVSRVEQWRLTQTT